MLDCSWIFGRHMVVRSEVDTVDPDQTAPHEAVWSRSTDLLCYINLLHLFNVRYNYVNT